MTQVNDAGGDHREVIGVDEGLYRVIQAWIVGGQVHLPPEGFRVEISIGVESDRFESKQGLLL